MQERKITHSSPRRDSRRKEIPASRSAKSGHFRESRTGEPNKKNDVVPPVSLSNRKK